MRVTEQLSYLSRVYNHCHFASVLFTSPLVKTTTIKGSSRKTTINMPVEVDVERNWQKEKAQRLLAHARRVKDPKQSEGIRRQAQILMDRAEQKGDNEKVVDRTLLSLASMTVFSEIPTFTHRTAKR